MLTGLKYAAHSLYLHADNASFYCHNQVPFVMGTTGGDRHKLLKDTEDAGVYAVIAPQMGKQVCFQTRHWSFRAMSCACILFLTLCEHPVLTLVLKSYDLLSVRWLHFKR